MTQYIVYYEINGRKMKTVVQANSKLDAIELIRRRLIVHKVEPVVTDPFSSIFGSFKRPKQ